ncbi:hypothetical protein VPH35_032057 [Triticum aestivum]
MNKDMGGGGGGYFIIAQSRHSHAHCAVHTPTPLYLRPPPASSNSHSQVPFNEREGERSATIKAEAGEAQRKEAERKEQQQEQETQQQGQGLTARPPLANGRSGMLPMSSPPANPGQLTIFYGGSVCVYDSVPPEKAQAIMLIAAAAAAASKSNGTAAVKPPAMSATNAIQAMLTRSLSLQSTSVANGQPQAVADPGSICKLQADLPIARRHSLQRFLEKRRDRLA